MVESCSEKIRNLLPLVDMSLQLDHIGGVTIESSLQNGECGMAVKDEHGTIDAFIPSMMIQSEEVAPDKKSPSPWWNKKKCIVIHASLMAIEASVQAMSCQKSSQSIQSETIVDISDGEVETTSTYNIGQYSPTAALVLTALSAYYFCGIRAAKGESSPDAGEAPHPEPAANERSVFAESPWYEVAANYVWNDMNAFAYNFNEFTSVHGSMIFYGTAATLAAIGAVVACADMLPMDDHMVPVAFNAASTNANTFGRVFSNYWLR